MFPHALLPIVAALAALFDNNHATLLFAGDAMMHQGQIDAARIDNRTYDFSECFSQLKPLIQGVDYAVVNLETPLGGAPYSGYPCFCAPDSYADALSDAGFDLFLTANNHTLDRRDKGLKRTIEVLDEKNISHIGTYLNAVERDASLPFIREINGFKIGFLNYTYGTNGFSPQSGTVVDYIDKSQISKDISNVRAAGAEIICVAIHWGEEYKLLPNSSQKDLAKFLLSQDVDMVIGGHPHVIQPMELIERPDGKRQLLVYSLGNFISNMKTKDTRGGALTEVHLSRNAEGQVGIDSAYYRLVFTVPGAIGKSNYRVIDADSCSDSNWKQHCNAFVNSAMTVFSKHNVNVPRKSGGYHR